MILLRRDNMSSNIRLTSGEIASLWTNYMNDSMSKLILNFMIKDIKDKEILPIVQYARDMSNAHLNDFTKIFEVEEFAIPKAFGEDDVNMEAP